MLPVVTKLVSKYNLKDFIVVADSGLMNGDMIKATDDVYWWNMPMTVRPKRTRIIEKRATNTNIPASEVYAAYHNIWYAKRAFRISKSKIEIRPMFHFTRRRIGAHVCICLVALKVYKELERLLKLSTINMSVNKVLELAQTIATIQMTLPSKQTDYQSDNAYETTSTYRAIVL